MFTAAELASILAVDGSALEQPDATILDVAVDSRQITRGSETLFVALSGKRTDGHEFVHSAWESGVRNFIVRHLPEEQLAGSNIFLVDDCIAALQQMAIGHRKRFDIPCIGITGSNGKTWVKEWLFQMLSPDERIVKSPRSYNSQIGVPLSVLRMRPHHTLALFEAGISKTGEMEALAEVIRPTIGILTHFGDAHQAGFPGPVSKLREKCLLFRDVDTVLYAGDDPWLEEYMHTFLPGKTICNWGHSESATMQIATTLNRAGCEIQYQFDGAVGTMHTRYRDAASVRNALTCCLTLAHLGYQHNVIAERLGRLQPLEMRLRIHQLPAQCILIDDSYSMDLASLQIGLETLVQHSAGMDRILVISDIDQQHAVLYDEIRRLLNERRLTAIFTIGEAIGKMTGLNAEHRHFKNVEAFIASRVWSGRSRTAFLLKGARRFGMERIVQHMQARLHSAVLEIDLNALLLNLQYYRSKLRPSTKIIAMVKAAAYGSGAAEIGKFLEFHNVDALGVAYIDEGIELRNAGVAIPVIVMNPDSAAIHHMVEHDLEPEVFHLDLLRELVNYVDSRPVQVRVHIKLDTGMHRLGLEEKDIGLLKELLAAADGRIRVASVFTHLAAAGLPEERDFTLVQLNRFEAYYQAISGVIGYKPERHVLNSGGVAYYAEYQYEAVRLGIGMYGVGATFDDGALEPVHTLKARISQIRDVAKGESVGYDRAFVAEHPMRIATVNVGYADGLMRLAGNGRYAVRIGQAEVLTVGNVCMDMTMLDVTQIKDIGPGDEVIIFGGPGTLDALAHACQTIPYEILTGISPRIPRIFRFA